jgi:hypothetical protein
VEDRHGDKETKMRAYRYGVAALRTMASLNAASVTDALLREWLGHADAGVRAIAAAELQRRATA